MSTSAEIWKFFTRNKDEAICNSCERVLKTPTGTTTTLKRHLESKGHEIHLQKYTALIQENSAGKSSGLTQSKLTYVKAEVWSKTHPSAKQLTTAVAEMMALDFQPCSIVEDQGFMQLLKIAEPRYSLPCRTTFSRNIIPKLYEDKRLKMVEKFAHDGKNLQSLSITTDLWTSRTGDPFISLTVHYIDDQFKMIRLCLEISSFPGKPCEDKPNSDLFKLGTSIFRFTYK